MDELRDLTERIDYAGGEKVDAAARRIRDASILSEHSANGYDYERPAMREGAALYEGAPVYVTHDGSRSPLCIFGLVRAPRYVEEGAVARIRGDIEVAPGPEGDRLLWLAKNAPANLGLSHVVSARTAA